MQQIDGHSLSLLSRHIIVYTLTIFSLPISGQDQYTANIIVDLQKEKGPVPAGLYGIFMEEINHAFDGGIYGELIQNRSFEEGILPAGMKVVKAADGGLKMELKKMPEGVPRDQWDMPWPWNMNCRWDPVRRLVGWSLRQKEQTSTMALTDAYPMNEASYFSLELKVAGTGREIGEVSLINNGYWGINIKKGCVYDLKFYLRPGTYQGQLTVALEDDHGEVLAKHSFGTINPGTLWTKFSTGLKAKGNSTSGELVMTFNGTGNLQVDWISLFPPTYKRRENGLREDLAQYLEDLKPAFIRYPGGCYVEGFSWESAPDWRTMVCPPEERPGTWSYWKYRSTDGFGYHEFLEFCEDIHADAMYVVFAGMTVHPYNNWPLDDIDTIIQQALDAIEYAIGPVNSKWGAIRAKMGHPDPFPLKYIEIGNEHPPAIYGDYYIKFRDAIKAKYPQIIVIMSMYWSGLNQEAIDRAGDKNIDLVDEHAYRSANWIRYNFDYFDKYERKPWAIYIGEYASQRHYGDLLCALDDAVFLMMTERNGDMVKMASYAPLFVNVNDRSWDVNLIEFDASRSFAHTSYYVQKVFNENRPDVNLEITSEITPEPEIIYDAEKHPLQSFFTAAGYDRDDKEVVIKAVNYYRIPVQANIILEGTSSVGSRGNHIIISSANLDDENSLDQPHKIIPIEKPLKNCSGHFSVILPPYSINILNIPIIK